MKKNLLLTFAITIFTIGFARAQSSCYAGFVFYNFPGDSIVNFYDSSYVANDSIYNYAWNFGDTSPIVYGADPIHVFPTTGTYVVSLTIYTIGGCQSSYVDTINVGFTPCTLGGTFTYSQPVQTLTFLVNGGTAPYAYAWSNGSTGQSIQAFAVGTYCVTVSDANGCAYQACYSVTTVSTCHAGFTAQNTPGSSFVSFMNSSFSSNGTITNYTWSFGDGGNSNSANPNHTYSTNGIYLVSLTISTSGGCSNTAWDTIYVGGQPCNLTASVIYNAQGGYLDAQIASGTAPFSIIWSPTIGLSNPASLSPLVSVAVPTTYCVTITDSTGCSYTGCVFVQPAYTDSICGNVFNDINGNGIQDSTEYAAYGYVNIYGTGGQYAAVVDSLTGHFSAGVAPGVYSIWFCSFGQLVNFSIPINDTAGCAHYDSVFVSGGGTNCGYNFGIQYNQAFIEGDIFIDSNNNGVFDSNESGIPYQSLHAGNYWGYSDLNGHYRIAVAPGTYTISFSPSGIYAGYILSTPASHTITLLNGATSYHNSFGIYVAPGSTNLSVSIVPHTTVTPGFPAWYDIYVNNLGATATGAVLTMQYDASLNFQNASPVQSTVNSGTQTITWNIPTIIPGNSRSFYVRFTASTGISIGASTFEFVDVAANSGIDVNLNNNFDSIHQIVTGSWDPNNKLVVSSNYSDPTYQVVSSVNPNQTIDYTINFQNTGTAAAVNISVLDDLSSDLDPNSFVLMGTSHAANVTRNGNHLSFVFPSIMLADSNHNEPASHGFINFRVNAINGLQAGHTILDKADIYFDFNAAVPTNTADLLLINPLGIFAGNALEVSYVSPNPSKGLFTLHYALNSLSDVHIYLKTIQGKVLETELLKGQRAGNNAVQLDASTLADGIYLLEIRKGDSIETIKLVKTN